MPLVCNIPFNWARAILEANLLLLKVLSNIGRRALLVLGSLCARLGGLSIARSWFLGARIGSRGARRVGYCTQLTGLTTFYQLVALFFLLQFNL